MSEETVKPLMSERTKFGLEILEAAVLLGILGDVMLRQIPWGLNVLLFIAGIVSAMIAIVYRRKRDLWTPQTIGLHAALVFFAAMFAWRDSSELQFFDAVAILSILAILSLPALKIKPQMAGVSHYIFGWVWSGISAAFAPIALLLNDIKWKTIPQTGFTKHLVAVLRGLAIATPILLIFGALFMAADAVYEGLVQKTLNISPDIIISHVFLVGFFSWTIAGYLRASLMSVEEETEVVAPQPLSIIQSVTDEKADETLPKNEPKVETKTWDWRNFNNSILPASLTLGTIEMTIVLGLINLLFLSFVIVQIPYLFGGFELVQQTEDLKLADYARRGFGELVTVAALVLPILLASHWLLRKDKPINEKIYKVLAGVQIALLFVIMASAAQRLLVLTGNLGYGLTTVRFYPMVFMIWLAIVFVWFGMSVLVGLRERFAWGALWSALLVLGVLHVVNPDDYIARANIKLMQQGRYFDANYHRNLSDDAAPILLENLGLMNFNDQCRIKEKYKWRLEQSNSEKDIRSFNYSRWQARKLLEMNQENLQTNECPVNTASEPIRD